MPLTVVCSVTMHVIFPISHFSTLLHMLMLTCLQPINFAMLIIPFAKPNHKPSNSCNSQRQFRVFSIINVKGTVPREKLLGSNPSPQGLVSRDTVPLSPKPS